MIDNENNYFINNQCSGGYNIPKEYNLMKY